VEVGGVKEKDVPLEKDREGMLKSDRVGMAFVMSNVPSMELPTALMVAAWVARIRTVPARRIRTVVPVMVAMVGSKLSYVKRPSLKEVGGVRVNDPVEYVCGGMMNSVMEGVDRRM